MSAAQYRKRPVVINAWRIDTADHDGLVDIISWINGNGGTARAIGWNDKVIAIDTLEGTMDAGHGDYVIQGVQGEFYFCRGDIFEQTYERVEETA